MICQLWNYQKNFRNNNNTIRIFFYIPEVVVLSRSWLTSVEKLSWDASGCIKPRFIFSRTDNKVRGLTVNYPDGYLSYEVIYTSSSCLKNFSFAEAHPKQLRHLIHLRAATFQKFRISAHRAGGKLVTGRWMLCRAMMIDCLHPPRQPRRLGDQIWVWNAS